MTELDTARPKMPWAAPGYLVLLALGAVAFWPGYLAMPKLGLSAWLHLHALSATAWMVLLIAQPLLLRAGRNDLHRALGRASWVLMPVVLLGFIGLAHASMQDRTPAQVGMDAYFFYLRVVLVGMFVFTWAMGMRHRHRPAIHARFMVCTGLSMIDPVVHRLAYRALRDDDFNYQLVTFGLVVAGLLVLIALERKAKAGRFVFPLVLGGYVVIGLPLALDFYTWGAPWKAWKAIAAAFAAL